MKQRFIRVGDEITDDTTLVIRGGLLDEMLLRADALRNHEIYGTYGISVLALRDVSFDELASGPPLVRFASLTLVTAGELRSRGLRLEATGRNRRHFDVGFDDLEAGVDALLLCERSVVGNPYHEGE